MIHEWLIIHPGENATGQVQYGPPPKAASQQNIADPRLRRMPCQQCGNAPPVIGTVVNAIEHDAIIDLMGVSKITKQTCPQHRAQDFP